MNRLFKIALALMVMVFLFAGSALTAGAERPGGQKGKGGPQPTATPTASPTASPTGTPLATPTATPTPIPTATPTATPTASPTATPTTTPPPVTAGSPYGVNDWNFTDQAMTAMKAAGISWARIMVNWNQIEPTQGSPVWNQGANSNIDYYISQTQKYGISVTASLFNAPSWAEQPGLVLPQPDLYASFVTRFLSRYPGKIAAVEILNEENTGTWPDTRNRDARLYIPILQAAYKATKAVSPSTLVTTSGMWGSPIGYLEDLYTLGGKGYFDVVNFHYYSGENSPAASYSWWISNLHQITAKYGEGNKPIWVGEFGWSINDENRPAANIVTPQQQTDYMKYMLQASMQSGYVQRVFPYVMRADYGMALMHATDNFSWNTPQPPLASSVSSSATSLAVTGDWTKHWPANGVVIIDSEQVSYSSLALSGGNTIVNGLARGANRTASASHASGTTAYNRDLTANYKRDAYNTYASFIASYPSWSSWGTTSLPDVPPAATKAVAIANPGFENGLTGWSGSITTDNTQFHSGTASAKMVNTSGSKVQGSQRSLALEAGKSYFFKGWVKVASSSSASMSTMISGNILDSAGSYISEMPGNYYVYGTNGAWREVHFAFRAPANGARLSIYLTTEGGTGTVWFDDISVQPYTLQ